MLSRFQEVNKLEFGKAKKGALFGKSNMHSLFGTLVCILYLDLPHAIYYDVEDG